MKHVTYSNKSLLFGDEAADVLMEYAALLAHLGDADKVDVRAITSEGAETVATFLLDPGANLMAESATVQVEEPDNAEAIAYMRSRIELLTNPPAATPDTEVWPEYIDDLDY